MDAYLELVTKRAGKQVGGRAVWIVLPLVTQWCTARRSDTTQQYRSVTWLCFDINRTRVHTARRLCDAM
jgi:hypothetical protein